MKNQDEFFKKEGVTIEYLPLNFVGTGEVKGFKFTKIHNNGLKGSLFQVDSGSSTHFEVVKSIYTPKCIDFENRVYSETEFKESYPNASRFGTDAWSFYTFDSAFKKLMSL